MVELKSSTINWKGAEEPIAVTNVDVLAAMAETDPNESHGEQSRYVRYGDQEYPLKYVVGRAIAHTTGEERRKFHSDRAEELVEDLGFEAVRK